jgi:hypothetical protein
MIVARMTGADPPTNMANNTMPITRIGKRFLSGIQNSIPESNVRMIVTLYPEIAMMCTMPTERKLSVRCLGIPRLDPVISPASSEACGSGNTRLI